MSKINETLNIIQAGSRANKYRVLYPIFGKDLDIVCQSTSMPGREIGTVDVFVKGRKYQLAGDMADDGTWEMTIYNTPDMLHRKFFLKMIGGVQNFNSPDYLIDGGQIKGSDLNGGTNFSVSGANNSTGDGIAGFFSGVSSVVSSVNAVYNDLRTAYRSVKNTADNIKQAINGDWNALESLITTAGYDAGPWYQQEIILQQLDHNENVISEMKLNNCFVTAVGPIEYSDESQEITTSTITFAYSGTEYGSNTEIPLIEKY